MGKASFQTNNLIRMAELIESVALGSSLLLSQVAFIVILGRGNLSFEQFWDEMTFGSLLDYILFRIVYWPMAKKFDLGFL